jgi:hypothetical protein
MQSKLKIPDNLISDFTWLRETHGINEIMFESLLVSKDEALAHIKFFKRMVFISNCAVMIFGLCLIGWGFKNGISTVHPIRIVMGILGLTIFLWFCQVFVRGVRSAQAIERIAQKHNLV